jgi:type IV pilus assembly protein PilE
MKTRNNREIEQIMRDAGGFTLIELMIVVAVVTILSTIAYPSYQEAVRRGKRAEGRAALMQLMQQQERYYSQRNTYIAFSSASTDDGEKKFKWFSGDNAANSAYEISAVACTDDTIENCVQLAAQPGGPKVDRNFSDPVCGSLTFTSTGVKGADDDRCWK